MAVIFISHSRKDEELVYNVQKLLANVGHTPIIEEFVQPEDKVQPPHAEIAKNVELCDLVFLFLTDNIVSSKYTENWVIFEVGLARMARKPVYVFERLGVPVEYPIPYVTDYMLFDKDSTRDILDIQDLSRRIGQFPLGVATGAGGVIIGGLTFGPLGALLGGLIGLLAGTQTQGPSRKVSVTCRRCGNTFNYWSPKIRSFNCPCCRRIIQLGET